MRQLKISKSITNRNSEALDKYLVEIGRAPMISIDDEIELAQEIRKGGKKGDIAKKRLIEANLRFVVSVAKQYQHQGLTLTDLIDEGNIGLIWRTRSRVSPNLSPISSKPFSGSPMP